MLYARYEDDYKYLLFTQKIFSVINNQQPKICEIIPVNRDDRIVRNGSHKQTIPFHWHQERLSVLELLYPMNNSAPIIPQQGK